MALVTGAIVTMAMIGGMVAQYPLTLLVEQVGWRAAVQDIGLLGVVMLLIMYWWIQENPQAQQEQNSPALGILVAAKKAYFNPQFIRAALYTSLMNMAIAIFGAMMGTLYLQQRLHINADEASLVNSMLFIGAIFGGPMIGGLSDRLRLRIWPMKMGVLISLAILLAVLYLPVSAATMKVLFFLLGFFTMAQVISYALVAESSPAVIRATAVSVISILTQGGVFVYQNLFGHLLLSHGNAHLVNGMPVYSLADYQSAAMMLPIGLVLAFLVLFGLKETHCQQQEN
jgi:sugar phosphate permease